MIQAIPLLGPILETANNIFDRVFPNAESAQKAKNEFVLEIMKQDGQMQKALTDIVQAEAASKHFLAANWRPITMLSFVGLIVARWFGFTAPELSEAEYLKLWDIVELGLGGYVIGRSVEKSLPKLGEILKSRG